MVVIFLDLFWFSVIYICALDLNIKRVFIDVCVRVYVMRTLKIVFFLSALFNQRI